MEYNKLNLINIKSRRIKIKCDKITIMLIKTLLFLFLLNIEPTEMQIPRVSNLAEKKELAKMLRSGTVVIVHQNIKAGIPQFISSGTIVNAGPEKVWNVITDFEHYHEFMPQTDKVTVKSRKDNTLAVEYNLNFEFTIIKLKMHYVLSTILNPPTDIWWSIKKDEKNDISETTGRWEIIPYDNDRTLIFYTIYTDLKSSGKIIRYFLNQQPQLELAIQVSTATLVVESVKKRAEDTSLAPQKSP